MLRAYVHVPVRKEFFHMRINFFLLLDIRADICNMLILNWDFDILPITFDENFMLCSLAESM